MNRKSNPLVALIALLLLLVLIFCAGCDDTTEATETESPRFIVEEASADTRWAGQQVEIITDTETGVQYIFVKWGNAGGLTVLEPAPEKEATP